MVPYNTLTGGGHDGEQITMLPVDGGGSSGGGDVISIMNISVDHDMF